MPEEIYEVLSLGMRYWFVLLGALIVWRAFGWLRKDRRAKHRRLRQLPDAGMIGELVVLVGSDELPEGTTIPIPREGVLGFLRTCDVVVPVPGVQARHLDFSFQQGKGLLIRPWRGCTCQVDADEMDHRSKPGKHPMHHGSRLFVGDAVLRLRVFAGLDVARRVMYAEDEPEAAPAQDPQAQPDEWDAYQQPYAPYDPQGYGQPWPHDENVTNQPYAQQPYAPYDPQGYGQPWPQDGDAANQPYAPYDPQGRDQPWPQGGNATNQPYAQQPYAPYDPQGHNQPWPQGRDAVDQDPWMGSGYPQSAAYDVNAPADEPPFPGGEDAEQLQYAQPRLRRRRRSRDEE